MDELQSSSEFEREKERKREEMKRELELLRNHPPLKEPLRREVELPKKRLPETPEEKILRLESELQRSRENEARLQSI